MKINFRHFSQYFLKILTFLPATALLAASQATTTTKLTTSPNPSSVGQSVTLTATLTPKTATGSVDFMDGSTKLGSKTLSSGTATFSTSSLTAGNHSLTAVYAGDTSNAESTSAAVSQTVNAPKTQVTLKASSASTTYGQSVTLTANLTPATATGSISFQDNGTEIGTGTIAKGTATFSLATLATGTHPLTAVYAGDSNVPSGTSSAVSITVKQAKSTITLTSSANPAGSGQGLLLTATVTPAAATGTVNFLEGSTTLGSGTLSNGTATFTISTLSLGSHTITAAYGGDTNNLASTSAPFKQAVSQATTTTLTVAPNPTPFGQTVILTATVSPASATGTITFQDGTTTLGSNAVNGNGIATFSLSAPPIGAHTLTAIYVGDKNNAGSTSPPFTLTVSQNQTTTTLVASPPTSPYGQNVTLVATVTPLSATGSVTFKDGAATLGSGTVNSGTATFSLTTLSVGTHSLTASYGGDKNNAVSTSTAVTESVSQGTTTTALTSSANPSTYGQAVTLTAAVVPATASGSVTFKDGSMAVGSAALNGGTATVTLSTLGAGSHTLTAVYGGDGNNGTSTSTGLTQTVNQAATTITLTSSANPSIYGQNVTLTATVSPSTATGSVTFKDGSTTLGTSNLAGGTATLATKTLTAGAHSLTAVYSGDTNNAGSTSTPVAETVNQAGTTTTLSASSNPATYGRSVTLTAVVTPSTASGSVTFQDGSIALGTGNLSNGTATLPVTTLSGGVHSLTAAYGGDANSLASTSAAFTLTVNPASTTTTLTSSANPSMYGQSVTLTASVTPSQATGSVTFQDGATTLGTGTLSGGVASLPVTTLSGGSHAFTASYSGDANDSPSTSSPLTQTVNPAPTSTALISSINPCSYGQSITLTATVSTSGSGSVTFRDGSTTLGSSSLSGGNAALTTTGLSVGTHSLTAVYSGDADNAASTSPVLPQTVNATATTITLTSSPNPSSSGQSLTLMAVVSPPGSGTVTFQDGSTILGTAPLNGGTATLTAAALSIGIHTLTAVYGGDSSNAASTSPVLTQTVNAASTTTTLSASPNPSPSGQSVTLTATVSPSTASGTITFMDGAAALGSGALTSGTAGYTTATLPAGTHYLTAIYNGDDSNAASTSATFIETIDPVATTITLASSLSPSAPGQPVILTAVVSVSNASGTVTFMDGSTNLGSAPLAAGTASLAVSTLASGIHGITATYSGDSSNAPSTSASLAQIVTATGLAATLIASPVSLSINYQQGSALPAPETLTVSSTNGTQLPFTVSADNGIWLVPAVSNGTTPQPFTIAINPEGLDPDTYNGTLTICSQGLPPLVVSVTLTVTAPAPPQLSVNPSPVSLQGMQGLPPSLTQILVANSGGGALNFSVAASGGAWLSVSPSSGTLDNTASSASSLPVMVTCDPASLDPGTYSGELVIAGAGSSVTIPVTFLVAAPQPLIQLSQSSLNFTTVSQGGIPVPRQLGILNAGTGSMDWSASASTLSGGNWLLLSDSAGTVQQPWLDVALTSVSLDPAAVATLDPGNYSAQIQVTGPAANSPQVVGVNLTVLPPGSDPGPEVNPAGLIFTGQAGISPDPQAVTIGIRKADGDQYVSGPIGSGFTFAPTTASLQPGQLSAILVVPDFTLLAPGEIDHGSITLQFSDGTVRTINTLTVVAPSDPASTCSNLMLQWRAPSSSNFTVAQGSGQTLELQVVDNCGNLIGPGNPVAASVVASFSNLDPGINLIHIGGGVWTGTWVPVNSSPGPVTVTVMAFNSTSQGPQSGQASLLLGTSTSVSSPATRPARRM